MKEIEKYIVWEIKIIPGLSNNLIRTYDFGNDLLINTYHRKFLYKRSDLDQICTKQKYKFMCKDLERYIKYNKLIIN